MATRTPAPWTVANFSSTIVDSDGCVIMSGSVSQREYTADAANAEFATLCVNFLSSVPAEVLKALAVKNITADKITINGRSMTEKMSVWAGLVEDASAMKFEFVEEQDDEIDEFYVGNHVRAHYTIPEAWTARSAEGIESREVSIRRGTEGVVIDLDMDDEFGDRNVIQVEFHIDGQPDKTLWVNPDWLVNED